MQQSNLERGQTFGRMATMFGFLGILDFWTNLDEGHQRKYATICRVSPRVVSFSLDKYLASEEIQGAVAEYVTEKESEATNPTNEGLEF